MKSIHQLFTGIIFLLVASVSFAGPIHYQATLAGDTYLESSMKKKHWYQFSGQAGDVITITLRRLEAALDPAFTLFFGADRRKSLEFVAFADDEIAPLSGLEGPWADAQLLNFTLAETGDYSLKVFSFISGRPGNDRKYDYSLEVSGLSSQQSSVAEPALFGLFALSLGALVVARRKA